MYMHQGNQGLHKLYTMLRRCQYCKIEFLDANWNFPLPYTYMYNYIVSAYLAVGNDKTHTRFQDTCTPEKTFEMKHNYFHFRNLKKKTH